MQFNQIVASLEIATILQLFNIDEMNSIIANRVVAW